MRSPRFNYVVVGTFVIAMLAGVIVAIAMLSGRTGATDSYFTSYADTTGLKYGSLVLYQGYPVGQVEEITPVPGKDGNVRFDVRMSITEQFAKWHVPKDSRALIRAAGLLAAVTIDIRAGHSKAYLKPDDHIVGEEQTNMFAAVTDTANTLRDLTETRVKPLIANLDRAVAVFSSVVEKDAGPLVRNLGVVADQLARRSPKMIDNFLTTTDELSRTSRSLRQILSPENATKIGNVVDNVEAASAQVLALSENARRQLDVLLGDTTTKRVDAVLSNLTAASGDVRSLAGTANARVGRILSEDNAKRVDAILGRVEHASGTLDETLADAHRRIAAVLDDKNVAHVDATLANVDSAAKRLDRTIADVRAQILGLLGPTTREKVDRALTNVSEASANVAALSRDVNASLKDVLTPETAGKIRRALDNFAGAASNVATLTSDLNRTRARLDRLLETLDGIAKDNRPDLREVVADLRHSLMVVSQHIDAIGYNLEGTSRNMFEFSRQLRANPSVLLRGARPAEDVPGGERRSGE